MRRLLISDIAIFHISTFLKKRQEGHNILRLGVRAKKYFIECADRISPIQDHAFNYGDFWIVIDKDSSDLLNGALLHWVINNKDQGLKIYGRKNLR